MNLGNFLDSSGLQRFWNAFKTRLLPSGGTSGQVLSKSSGSDYAVGWSDIPSRVTTTATLTANGWSSNSQTVNVSGVTASNDIIVTPAPESVANWAAAGVYCSAQGSGALTFACTTAPSSALTANVMVFSG